MAKYTAKPSRVREVGEDPLVIVDVDEVVKDV
jgi:hypothetical protein